MDKNCKYENLKYYKISDNHYTKILYVLNNYHNINILHILFFLT